MNTIHLNNNPLAISAGAIASLLLISASLALSGCLSRPALGRQTYTLDSASSATNKPAQNGKTVGIRMLEVCPLFDGRSFVYRTGADRYEVDPYAGFLIPSSRTIEISVRNYLRSSGAFKNVAEPGSRLAPETVVEIYVTELYGDFRPASSPAAVLSMRLLFFDAKNPRNNQPYLEKFYTRRVPLHNRNAPALVAGWNQALEQIMKEATSDFASTQQINIGSSDPRSSGPPLMRTDH